MNSIGWLVAGILPLAVAGMVRAHVMQESKAGSSAAAQSFDTDNAQAMARMMEAMSVQGTGDADRDFVQAMVPHHQGAVDMALAELRYGKDETLRRMAQEIIVEQRQEIDAMRLAQSKLPSKGTARPDTSNVCRSNTTSQPMRDTVVRESQ